MGQKAQNSFDREIRNNKASFKYTIGDKFEAGIALQGTEVKSIRAGCAQISEAFVRLDKDVPVLYNAHISEYEFGNINNHAPTRPRLLLLHKREIAKLKSKHQAGGFTIVPLRIYFKGSLVKVEIALCKGKKIFDKREDIKRRDADRETQRVLKSHRSS